MKPDSISPPISENLAARKRAHVHLRHRAKERYQIDLSHRDISAIEADIAFGRAVKSVDFCATRAGYSVQVQGKLIVVLYDSEIGAAITALPMVAIAKRIREVADAKA